ncbi:hypothetical protein AMS68_005387 [Peltaster fructicola]|uniref:Uncharacterized protein n=1 Tax=Peltaster fructicola TaxID=286661 RepID=A0A6H0XZN2_9PEZI|nr:hypothetical protein AMS68_005387 [Peltaster fructicola]
MRSTHQAISLLRRSQRLIDGSRICQRRWAQVHDVRFLVTHQKSSAVLDKYQSKLEQKAKEQGKSIDELRDTYKDKIQELRNKAIVAGANAPFPAAEPGPFQPPPPPKPKVEAQRKDGLKTLDNFVNVEKVSTLPEQEIEAIWRLRHIKDAQSLCALMKTDTFKRISETARRHPQFILPIPREDQGAEIHFMQWTFPSPTTVTVLFTHLAEFKLRGEYAQPHTTVTHHTDLSDSRGLVLLEGRVQENRGISVDEAKWLLMCLQKFYGFEAHSDAAKESLQRRRRLMEQFSGGDANFKVEDLLEEAEKVP